MLIRLLLSCSVWSLVWGQDNQNSPQGGAAQWGWQMNQDGPKTIGHYFVKLPQSEQQVRYVADGSGYHGAVAVVTADQHHSHSSSFALGQQAIDLTAQIPDTILYENSIVNNTQEGNIQGAESGQLPVQLFVLQQYSTPRHVLQPVSENLSRLNQDHKDLQNKIHYNVNVQHDKHKKENEKEFNANVDHVHRVDHDVDNKNENLSIVRVFKDSNCLNHEPRLDKQKSSSVSFYRKNLHGNFGAREMKRPQHQMQMQTESPRSNSRSERYYYMTTLDSSPTTARTKDVQERGISRLVASTQDLISNDDLLRINYAEEKFNRDNRDDIIKTQRHSKSNKNINEINKFRVTTKFGIMNNEERLKNNDKEINLQTSANEYRFPSPIVVEDDENYKEQILNNLMSTMVPYIQDGYEIIGVTKSFDGSNNSKPNKFIEITPRPLSQNYLAPITVALRLFNANNSNFIDSNNDYETADSEFVSSTVENPNKNKVTVEIQESLPVDITHINEVEYHQYLGEERSNTESPLNLVKSLYQKYVASLDTSNNHKQYSNVNTENSNDENSEYETSSNEEKETLEPSENIRSEVQIQNIEKNNGHINYYDDKGKIIQPIVIEKQVPITTYVDRYIEKQVPYPEPVEVVKQVPVDRPVPIPVHYETIVEKPVEVTRFVDKPYPVEVLQPFPVEVRVPYPVEHKVYVDRPIHIPYPVEKVIEKQMIHPIPVPTPYGIPVGIQVPVEKKVLYPVPIETPVPFPVHIEKHIPVEKLVQRDVPVPYPVEKKVPYPVPQEVQVPVPYPVEKIIPVEKIVEKPVTVTKVVEKPVHIKVPQPVPVEVHVPKPYPVDRIVEKKVPYPVPVDRIVERKVPVQIPYPVKVEKIVEKPIFFTKYIDRPFPVERRVPYPVEKIVEKKVPYPVEVIVEQNKKPDSPPYPFEKIESVYLYGYGTNQGYINKSEAKERHNAINPLYIQGQYEKNYGTQQQAESQRNYQVINSQFMRNIQNVTPVQSTYWGNQYASTFQYINTTTDRQPLSLTNYINNQPNGQKYFGPPPLKNYENLWENNKEHTEKSRKTERTPKMSNLRIEYGFKPPLIPSTQVDLDGLPVNKNES